MKLIRMIDRKIGLIVLRPNGPHVIDIANSLGVFAPHAPLSNGLLNGVFKDGCDWSVIVKHWLYLRSPLRKLANIALARPDHPCLAMQPLTDQLQANGSVDQIIAVDITEAEHFEVYDPTGRCAMERQFSETRDH